MSQNKRVCIRCLLRELSEKDYAENIEKYINALKAEDRVSDLEYERRLALCKECDKLNEGTCLSCGCYVEVRGASKAGHCPKKKW